MLVLLTLSHQPSPKGDVKVEAWSPEEERTFRGSRFELVALKLPFPGAQNWCEENGGSLALILDEDTQLFLERHMDSEKDMWIGLAPSYSTDFWNADSKNCMIRVFKEKVKHTKMLSFLSCVSQSESFSKR